MLGLVNLKNNKLNIKANSIYIDKGEPIKIKNIEHAMMPAEVNLLYLTTVVTIKRHIKN